MSISKLSKNMTSSTFKHIGLACFSLLQFPQDDSDFAEPVLIPVQRRRCSGAYHTFALKPGPSHWRFPLGANCSAMHQHSRIQCHWASALAQQLIPTHASLKVCSSHSRSSINSLHRLEYLSSVPCSQIARLRTCLPTPLVGFSPELSQLLLR